MRFLWAFFIVLIAAGTFFMVRPTPAPSSPKARDAAGEGETARAGAATKTTAAATGTPVDQGSATTDNLGPAVKPVGAAATDAEVDAKPTDGDAEKPKETASAVKETEEREAGKPEMPVVPTEVETTDPLAQLAADAIKQAGPRGGDAKASGGTGASGADAGEAFELTNHADFPLDKVIPARATKRADGAIVVDGRFVVTGEGTKASPYKVPWDLLVSAQEVYKPRSGLKKMPQRVTFLHDKYVKIVGFVAFPITSTNPKELLAMLNQWDGCCIGYPPTVFDAIEVALAGTPTNTQRMSVHGALDGRFRVDPYDEDGWIVGLYIMREGVLSPD